MLAQQDPGVVVTAEAPLPPLPASEAEHLLKVAACIGKDANQVWAVLWSQLRRHVSPTGSVLPDAEAAGFTPGCGWAAFLEQFWLLKHYLDSLERICSSRHSPMNPGSG